MVYRLDVTSAASAAPAAGAAGTEGFPADSAIIDPYWMYSLCEEIRNVVEAAGLTPTKANVAQLLASLNQAGPTTGSMRNAVMIVAAASANATFTADEIVVAKSLGGFTWKLGGFSETITLTSTGAGGMDTGAAPDSGYVAIYAIYNPQTQAAALLATNATSAAAPTVYGGAHMPAGYVYSGLVSVWPTTSAGLLAPGLQIGRQIGIATQVVLSSSSISVSLQAVSLAGVVPPNARKVSGGVGVDSTTATSSASISLFSTAAGLGASAFNYQASGSGAGGGSAPFSNLLMGTPQTIYYTSSCAAGVPAFVINISGYEF